MKNMAVKALVLACAACAAGGAAASAPQVSNVVVTVQNSSTQRIAIQYELESAAIVTVDVLTNGVSIGKSKLKFFSGACNRVCPQGTNVAYWAPHRAWPDGPRVAAGATFRVTAWSLSAPPDWMSIDLKEGGAKRFYTSLEEFPEPDGISNRVYKTTKLAMRKIPAAGVEWRMGDAGSGRLVTLTEDYYIGVYEVTRGQAKTAGWGVTGKGKMYDNGLTSAAYDAFPLESVHMGNIRGGLASGIDWPTSGTTVKDDSTVKSFRTATGLPLIDLPTESQWEFAFRAGTGTKYYNGTDDDSTYSTMGWYDEQTGGIVIPHEVGLLEPNAFGLYDMLGNVPEWCLDANLTLGAGSFTDPKTGPAADSDNKRVLRGGGLAGSSCGKGSAYYRGTNKDQQTAGYFCFGLRLCAPAAIPAP